YRLLSLTPRVSEDQSVRRIRHGRQKAIKDRVLACHRDLPEEKGGPHHCAASLWYLGRMRGAVGVFRAGRQKWVEESRGRMFALRLWRENELTNYPLPRLRDEFTTLFDRFFSGWPLMFEPKREPERFWNLEVADAEKEMVVRAEVPGFEAADLDVELRNH